MIEIFTTGGTIDKVYFDAKSNFQIGESPIQDLLIEANLTIDVKVTEVMRKDSLDMTDEDRAQIRRAIEASGSTQVVITHGTDTMVQTGRALKGIAGKTLVLTGAMQPARFRATDALFNVASALTAAQTLPPGVYIAMNGQIFDPQNTIKNVEENRFELRK
ncbi:asparaginase domain-containing protein [Geopsychrobacter electrodiphilus]|uniref:asparaginase domain-containing protein n=1 Tax=Geopsychrobacter electrodiphilus TaxID=225196 RepID=UPI0003667358|nr:asparaginase domain-containing protein [Geopsychrobacter electrodiphilus]